ncbi:MAG: winged helix-turn-helix domain-containing protein [Alphaproteobacteria bacterium]|nr:winged helix-turn-helix domain-containing protein [Alphaproteobacteria bacterium]
MLEVRSIHKAHCAKLGKNIPLSTTYRLLHRHGWRKIMPRSRHPKANKESQAAFKKMV